MSWYNPISWFQEQKKEVVYDPETNSARFARKGEEPNAFIKETSPVSQAYDRIDYATGGFLPGGMARAEVQSCDLEADISGKKKLAEAMSKETKVNWTLAGAGASNFFSEHPFLIIGGIIGSIFLIAVVAKKR
jgi:hypothetical protein